MSGAIGIVFDPVYPELWLKGTFTPSDLWPIIHAISAIDAQRSCHYVIVNAQWATTLELSLLRVIIDTLKASHPDVRLSGLPPHLETPWKDTKTVSVPRMAAPNRFAQVHWMDAAHDANALSPQFALDKV